MVEFSTVAETTLRAKFERMASEKKILLLKQFLAAEYAADFYTKDRRRQQVELLADYLDIDTAQVERCRKSVSANLKLIEHMVTTALTKIA